MDPFTRTPPASRAAAAASGMPSTAESESSESISRRLLERIFDVPRGPSGAAEMSPPVQSPFGSIDLHRFELPAARAISPQPESESTVAMARSAQESLPASVVSAMERGGSGVDFSEIDLQGVVAKLQIQSRDSLAQRLPGTSPYRADRTGPSGATQSQFSGNTGSSASPAQHSRPLDISSVRLDFPALHQSIHGFPLVWFDNAATTQKPRQVIEAMSSFYALDYSNIHRAAHTLAARATDHYEGARETVREFIHAQSKDDIVFVRGTTEGINFIAHTIKGFLREGDEILLSEVEHHANIVPWQMIAREVRARIRVIPIDDSGEILIEEYRRLLGPRTRLVSLSHASNTLGTVLPIEEMTQMAHHHGARVVIDAAQSIAHMPVDVQAIGCDFLVFSGHKIFAPTGIGVVYVHPQLHDVLPPWQGGGNMIRRVSFDETIYSDAPAKFEAGTPSIGDAVGLGAALQYLRQFDPISVEAHEHALLEHATRELKGIRGVTIYGHATKKIGVVSFTLDGYTTEMVGKELDRRGIAVRTGHHCAQPSLRHFGLESTVRPSFAIYNTHEEVERLIEAIVHLSRRR